MSKVKLLLCTGTAPYKTTSYPPHDFSHGAASTASIKGCENAGPYLRDLVGHHIAIICCADDHHEHGLHVARYGFAKIHATSNRYEVHINRTYFPKLNMFTMGVVVSRLTSYHGILVLAQRPAYNQLRLMSKNRGLLCMYLSQGSVLGRPKPVLGRTVPTTRLKPPFTAQNCPKLPKTAQNCLKLPTDYEYAKLILG